MKLFAVIVLLTPVVFAQELYRCDCALYADRQIGEDVMTPLAWAVSKDIYDPLTCNLAAGPLHPCAQFCNEVARNETEGGLGLCVETPNDESRRCLGGIMCEIMYADDHENCEDEPLRMYYRIRDCPANHNEWTASGFVMGEELCCNEGVYEPCIGGGCACYRYSYSYCECGIFVPEMFAVLDGNKIPLPLQVVGTNSTDQPQDESFCDTAGTVLDPCRQLCATEGQVVFDDRRLNDYPEDASETYGQIFCKSLYLRADQYEDWEELDTELGVWNRAPRCSMRDWHELTQTKHSERLCCDENGDNLYPCPNQLDFRPSEHIF